MKINNKNSETAGAAPEAVETAKSTDQIKEEWLAIRRQAGRQIDPETAEVDWTYGNTFDPYGIESELADQQYCIGRVYFARSSGSDIWVCFADIDKVTRNALWKKIDEGKLASTDDLVWLFE